jgi:amino acid transporter
VSATSYEGTSPTASTGPITDQAGPRLRGNLGVAQLFFSVMAWNAPLVIVVGIIPVMVVIGNGIATPIAFIVAGLIIAAFAVGFTRMARVLPNPGAFYSYITAGLGKSVGLGSGLLTLFGYFAAYAGTPAFGGVVLGTLVEDTLNGPDLPWWLWGSLFFLIAGILGYLRVELSAKVLTFVLALELIVIVVYDVLVAVTQGVSALSFAPFSPAHWFDGSFGIALLFGLGMYGGFEITALFRDEVRDPERTVPRATFAVIVTAMCLYAVTAWLFVNSVGLDRAVAVASADPTGSMTGSMAAVGSKILADSATVLVNTSTIAVVLAGHNIVARYVFNLSADRILPPVLSRVHPRHGSPYLASLATSVVAVAINIPIVLADLDPMATYAAMLGITSFVLILVLFLTNIAIPVYMRRHGGALFTLGGMVFCPIVAGVGLAAGVVLAATNFPLLIGGSTTLATTLMVVMLAIFSLGVVLAILYRRAKPDIYAKIGRQ